MIAKGKSISHGAAMIDYAAGRDKAQFLTSKFMNLDFEETFGIMPDNIWNSFRIHAMRHSPIKDSLMRFELAPSREESKGWTHEDWKAFLDEFIDALDSIGKVRSKGKNGKWNEIPVKPTNIRNSQSIAYLHLNTDDNHLHFLVNRIDEDGNVNDDSFLLNRCFMAAQIINERRGWRSTLERSEEIKNSIKGTAFDVLKHLDDFSWPVFIKAMKENGVNVKTKCDNSGRVVNYTLSLEGSHSKYKASDIDRRLTAAHITDTWKQCHRELENTREQTAMDDASRRFHIVRIVDTDDNMERSDSSRHITDEHSPIKRTSKPEASSAPPKRADDSYDNIHHHFKFGFYECKFMMKRGIEDLINSEIALAVKEEIAGAENSDDYDADEYLHFLRDSFDFDSAFKMAAMLFIDYVDGATAMSNSIGGGGGSCTGGWGKKKDDEDDEKWARRCASQAVLMSKPWHIGRRRGRGR